jgi:hypothetical protein
MAEPLKGAVAVLLTNGELVLNLGSEDGVRVGMRFDVPNSHGIDIYDPKTTEVLGTVELPKVIVEDVRVEDRLTVARTFQKRRRNLGGSGDFLGSAGLWKMFEPPRWVDDWETFKTERKPQVEEISEEDSYVKIGDPVVEDSGDEWTVPESPDSPMS